MVALVAAIGMTGMWMRSLFRQEGVSRLDHGRIYDIYSLRGEIQIRRIRFPSRLDHSPRMEWVSKDLRTTHPGELVISWLLDR